MPKCLINLVQDRRGATAIEYGLILALIFLVMMGGVGLIGDSTRGAWGNFTAKVVAVTPAS